MAIDGKEKGSYNTIANNTLRGKRLSLPVKLFLRCKMAFLLLASDFDTSLTAVEVVAVSQSFELMDDLDFFRFKFSSDIIPIAFKAICAKLIFVQSFK